MDYSLPSSSVHGIFQARVLEWGAIAFSVDMLSRLVNFPSKEQASFNFMATDVQEMSLKYVCVYIYWRHLITGMLSYFNFLIH